MEIIRTDALRDVIALCPPHMLEHASTIDDQPAEIVTDRGICVDYDDWKIIFHGYGIVEISKGDNDPITYGANDPAYHNRPNVLSLMMAHYERKIQLHEAVQKYKAKREEIHDAARKLYDNGAIDAHEYNDICARYNLRWVFDQAKAEIGMEV